MTVSLTKLQQLITVARCGNISRAADELHISQPALSRSIAALEARYGFPIFNRIGHGVQPTAAGAQILAQAEPLLQAMRVFGRNVDLLAAGKAGRLSIGIPPLLASQLLSDLAGDFFAPRGDVELQVSIRSGPALLDQLKDDEIEFFVFAQGQVEPGPEIEAWPVGTMQPACVVRTGHPLAARRGLTARDLSAFPWASSVEPPAMGELLNPARLLCDNYHILREAVLRTDMVCICSRAFVSEDLAAGRLCELDVPGFLPATIRIECAALKGRILSPLAHAAVARIGQLLTGGMAGQVGHPAA